MNLILWLLALCWTAAVFAVWTACALKAIKIETVPKSELLATTIVILISLLTTLTCAGLQPTPVIR